MSKYSPLLVFLLLSTGCATIFTGMEDEVLFTSQPSGAMVYLDGHPLGRTPLITEIPRRTGSRFLTYELDGYDPATQSVRGRINGVTFINLLWWPGFLVDLVTGAITKVEYDTYYMELDPIPETIRRPE